MDTLQLRDDDIEKIASIYELAVTGFDPFEGGASNSSYLLHAQQGDYVLTLFEIAPHRVSRLGQLLLLLAEYGFPAPRLLPPAEGGVATTHKGKPVMLTPYIAGQVCHDLDEEMLCQVGVVMARLHQVPVPDFLPDQHAYGLQVFRGVLGRDALPEYESWLSQRLAYLEQLIPRGLPRSLIHGDLFYDNVLFEGRKLKAIIDFEEACRYYPVFDLGMGIVGLCTTGQRITLSKARALVAGYQQVRVLQRGERDALRLFVEYAATATSFWRFRRHHLHAPSAEMADRHWQMVNVAEQVAAIPDARFLEVVFGVGL